MRLSPLLSIAAVAVLAVALWFPRPGGAVAEPVLLDAADADYYEDAAVSRAVAAVQAAVLARGDEVRLQIAVSALGDHVEPVPGLEGVFGANLRTAEELHRLLAGGLLRVETRIDGRSVAGDVATVERGHLPARALRADGTLVLHAEAPAELPVRATFRTAPLGEGTSQCYLVAEGVPRLRVEVARSGDHAHIAAIESLGDPINNRPARPEHKRP
jgi:hypothetical protein